MYTCVSVWESYTSLCTASNALTWGGRVCHPCDTWDLEHDFVCTCSIALTWDLALNIECIMCVYIPFMYVYIHIYWYTSTCTQRQEQLIHIYTYICIYILIHIYMHTATRAADPVPQGTSHPIGTRCGSKCARTCRERSHWQRVAAGERCVWE